MVVSVAVNVGTISRRVRLREASASKPSMKCRKRIRRCQNRGLTLVWGFRCQGVSAGRRRFFLRQFDPLSSPRPALRSGRRAQVRSRLVVAPTLRHARPLLGRADDQRGARFRGADQSRHNLVFGGSKNPNHDAAMRIGSEAPKRRTHSSNRHESQGTCRESDDSSSTSSRISSEISERRYHRARTAPSVLLKLPAQALTPALAPDCAICFAICRHCAVAIPPVSNYPLSIGISAMRARPQWRDDTTCFHRQRLITVCLMSVRTGLVAQQQKLHHSTVCAA